MKQGDEEQEVDNRSTGRREEQQDLALLLSFVLRQKVRQGKEKELEG